MKTTTVKEKYIEAVGRRKTSSARVRIYLPESAKNHITVNDKELAVYFPTAELRTIINEPLTQPEVTGKYTITAKIVGGGVHGQAEALRHGIARALTLMQSDLRKPLKKVKLLRRDPRAKERRKFGLKKARKAPQWSKR